MVESAAMLVDTVLPHQPIRQWVLSVPFPLRWLFASEPRVLSKALEVVTRAISTYLVKKAGFTHTIAKTGIGVLKALFPNFRKYCDQKIAKKSLNQPRLPAFYRHPTRVCEKSTRSTG